MDSMDYYQTLERWSELQEAIRRLQDEERALRQGLFDGTFPNPVEGTNKVELPDGRVLKGVLKINRKVTDTEAVANLPKKTREAYFRTKYEVKVTAYKELDTEGLAIIAPLIVETPGLPSLEIVPAKPKPEDVSP